MFNILSMRKLDLLSEGKDGLHGDVHDHHTLSAKVEGKNLKSVGNEETGETDGVEDTKEPDEGKLGISSALVGGLNTLGVIVGHGDADLRVLVDGTGDGPEGERSDHTGGSEEEKRATAESVDHEGGGDGDGQIKDGLAGSEL